MKDPKFYNHLVRSIERAVMHNNFADIQKIAHPHLDELSAEDQLQEISGFVAYVRNRWSLYYTIKTALMFARSTKIPIQNEIMRCGDAIISNCPAILLSVLAVRDQPAILSAPSLC